MALSKIPAAAFAADPGVNFRNLIINGDMSIAQRGTSTSSMTSSAYGACDRWNLRIISSGTYTMSQDTDVPTGQGFSKSTKIDCTTADASLAASDELLLRQLIEAQNLQHLKFGTSNAESLTVSFWVKSNKTGTYIVELSEPDASTRAASKSYTINSANTWEKKTITYTGDTSGVINNDNGAGLQLHFWLAAGSNFTSGTLAESFVTRTNADRAVGQVNLADNTANEWYITGVQLEVGTSASDFEFLPYDVNLQRCRRYYQKIHNTDGIASSTTEYRAIQGFYPTMRTSPSMSVNGPYEISDLYTYDAIQSSAAISVIGPVTDTRVFIQMVNFSSLTSGRFYAGPRYVNNDYYIFADAEL